MSEESTRSPDSGSGLWDGAPAPGFEAREYRAGTPGDVPSPAEGDARVVEVAVDAPGALRGYDYAVPARLSSIRPGEPVLVEFGRRQALGVVMGEADGRREIALRPLLARVEADGPLLPPLMLEFARWISAEYLAPPAAVVRSMLPPGMLERLELVAERRPAGLGDGSAGGPESGPLDSFEAGIRARLLDRGNHGWPGNYAGIYSS